ncbi:hypothetical protein V6N12_011318 [Hibiscus sabdariffa]|uniref:RNase H type-1 domain-containing protein n=1 Tax=Hibiscus sabdariffa TaxID=183260 RepID=A0ABR1ZH14_9ROSI
MGLSYDIPGWTSDAIEYSYLEIGSTILDKQVGRDRDQPPPPRVDAVWRRPPAETDCLEVSGLIKSPMNGHGNLTLVPHIAELIARLRTVRVEHVVREQNKFTDVIAKLAMRDDLVCHRFVEPPSSCVGQGLRDATTNPD